MYDVGSSFTFSLCFHFGLTSVSHLRLLFCFYGEVDLEVGLGGGGVTVYVYIYICTYIHI